MKVVLLCTLLLASLLSGARAGVAGRHGPPNNLSDQTHFSPEHNAEYDHDAFLGREEAQRFDQLSHQEAQYRLRKIVDKVDKNGDGQVDEQELVDWIRHVSHSYVYADATRQWPHVDRNEDGFITMEEVKEATYGDIEDDNKIYDEHRQLTVKEMKKRDSRRFQSADLNKDKKLDKEEFAIFLHPEERMELKDLVVDETLQDMDKNKDGIITLQEYIDDIWPAHERKENPEEPAWLKAEKENFHTHRDVDGDGALNREELANWVMPEGYDPSVAEAHHLIHEADANKDKMLSREEILESQDLFVGSQATDYGNYLIKINRHDEF